MTEEPLGSDMQNLMLGEKLLNKKAITTEDVKLCIEEGRKYRKTHKTFSLY